MNKKRIIIFGVGGFGREVLSFIKDNDNYKIFGFIDKKKFVGKEINGYKIIGSDKDIKKIIYEHKIETAFIAIGNRIVRKKIYNIIKKVNVELINIIHPSAVISTDCKIGNGVIVYPNVTINTNSKIGDSVLINSNVSIGHDCIIKSFTNINPGVDIAGKVVINKGVMIGIGAATLEEIEIGENVIVGGGALVNKDVEKDTVVVGVPAKKM